MTTADNLHVRLALRLSLWFFEVAARLLKTVPRQVARGVALSRWLPVFEGQGIVNPQEIEDKTSHQKIQVSSTDVQVVRSILATAAT